MRAGVPLGECTAYVKEWFVTCLCEFVAGDVEDCVPGCLSVCAPRL